ncbi:galactokinase [Shewanella sp. NFH-SH190041]|uniref:galactokinase n=1 Tax=Shewanella sp. NFH-SH190041 TaxID=2950245 RepID=UPI0021C39B9D|nr:galactokinase family protein [Shewanella sp. NFH-SH190041]BDM63220.1 galactokinase [Shewanella sp. NFH-SH190041]
MNSVTDTVTRLFQQAFSAEPSALYQSPGRVNLIGDYSDCHDGLTLCCAVDYHTVFAVKPRQDGQFRVAFHPSAIKGQGIHAGQVYQWRAGEEGAPEPDSDSLNNLKGITRIMTLSGLQLGGLDMAVASSIPANTAMGTNAALQTAFGTALNLCIDQPLSPLAIAQLAQRAEQLYLKHTCGALSQMSCVLAQRDNLLMIDSLDLDCQPIPLPENMAFLIIKPAAVIAKTEARRLARQQHCSTMNAFFHLDSLRNLSLEQLDNARSALSEEDGIDDRAFRQVRHLLSENQRAHRMVSALRHRNMSLLNALMSASHRSLVDDYGVDNPRANEICQQIQQSAGQQGAVRMTADQIILALLPQTLADSLSTDIHRRFPEADIYVCHAADAAGQIKLAAI